MSVTWAYGVTTVQERRNTTLPRTVLSLKAAGFDDPILFIDGDDDVHSWKKQYSLQCSIRYPKIHAWGNWILALYELYIRNPEAGRYVLFQDDIVVVKNLKQYLATCPHNGNYYWNLITYPENYALLEDKNTQGWFRANQKGLGAQGLVFGRQGVIDLLTSSLAVSRPQSPDRGKKNIDGGVVDTLRKKGCTELVHNPSLVFHIGDKSTIGHSKQPAASSFPGETFDAMQLTPTNGWKFGDHIGRALTAVGITSERVESWLGAECGCKDRREKLNKLGAWAQQAVSSVATVGKESLERILGGK